MYNGDFYGLYEVRKYSYLLGPRGTDSPHPEKKTAFSK